MSRRWLLWLPIALFAGLFALVASGLLHPRDPSVRSQMVGKKLPAFDLPGMVPGTPGLASTDLATGRPRLVNIFASWCIPCMAESPQLMRLHQAGVEIDGIAVRDTPADIATFLSRFGDPYTRIGDDRESAVQMELGSSGVPETFLIDARGRILQQHIGEITPDEVPDIIAKLKAAS